MSKSTRGKVFISYSHKDRKWLKRLQTTLKPLLRKKLIVWDDAKIEAGAKCKGEIEDALAQSHRSLRHLPVRNPKLTSEGAPEQLLSEPS